MAEKISRKNKGGKGKRAAEPEGQAGHNAIKIDRAQAKEFFDKLDDLHARKAADAASYAATIGDVYEKARDKLGIPKRLIKLKYAEHKFYMKLQEAEKAREEGDQTMLDALDVALGSYKSTPLGKAALERAERRRLHKDYEPPVAEGSSED